MKISANSTPAIVSRATLAVVLSALCAGIAATPASALTREAGCAELQSAIDEVAQDPNHGESDTIVLNGLCEASNLGSAGGVTLPAGSNFSIEGKPGTNSGFDGAGVDGPLLGTAGSEEAGAMTLGNLTFQHADLTGTSALSIRAAGVTLSNDRFLENDEHGENAHAVFVSVGQSPASCPSATGPPAIKLVDSTFSGNTLSLGSGPGGGAGAWLKDTCEHSRNALEGDAFEANTLEAAGTAEGVQVTGAGLHFDGGETQAATVSQRANVFDSNRILASSPSLANYGGGGEWIEGASLLSADDRFSRNAIAGTSSGSDERWSWGAGLGIDNLDFACSEPEFPQSTLENAVLAGNSIGPGTTVDLGGGGIWVGCTHLRVLDSTVTLNSASYGAGIEGEPGDQLELANSIVADNSGAGEVAGFEGEPTSSLTASFSDVCAPGDSSVPLLGAGNICANPLLADDGDPSSFDIHETESSPTIDAGSNALVPSGLSTDFYGNQRILSGRSYIPSCTPGETVIPILDPPTVDMGASELGPLALPAIAVLCPAPTEQQPPTSPGRQEQLGSPPPGTARPTVLAFSLPSLTQRPDGLLTLRFARLAVGRLQVNATFTAVSSVTATVKGKRRQMRKTETVAYGQAARTVASPGDAALTLSPNRQALRMLARAKRLRVKLRIALTPSGAAALSREETITVVYRSPRR